MSGALSGCQPPPDAREAGLELDRTALAWRDSQLTARAALDLDLSPAAREALRSGVELTITVDLRFGRHYRWFAREIHTDQYHWRIAYLPLSRHYRLTSPLDGETTNFPRLSQLGDELAAARWYPTRARPGDLGDGWYQLEIRARLNRLRLPAPLRLPSLFSREWLLTTAWQPLMVPEP